MSPRSTSDHSNQPRRHGPLPPRATKKQQIIDMFHAGHRDIFEISQAVDCRPSYVASVLQSQGLIHGYFDLYTNTSAPMNVYSDFFKGRLGFKNERFAKQSVEHIDRVYRRFGEDGDRAGQHHCLSVALTMYDRARWSGKRKEAEFFKRWLIEKLDGVE